MKKKKLLWLMPFLAAWLALLPACFKAKLEQPDPGTVLQEWDTLPAITQEGKHTFGCLVNGKVWVPHGINLMGGIKNMHLDESKNLGYGYGNCSIKWGSTDEYLSFSFTNTFFGPNQYYTTPDTSDLKRFSIQYADGHNRYYYPDESKILKSNKWEVTKVDTVKNYISGRFSFVLYQGNNHIITNINDSIVITDGRFDMLYYPQ